VPRPRRPGSGPRLIDLHDTPQPFTAGTDHRRATAPIESVEWTLEAPRRLGLRSRCLSALEAGWVRVRFAYCGVCGSDVSKFEGCRTVAYPMTLGHEFVGEVIAVGAGVDGLTPGDVVTSDLNYRCRTCDQCRAQRSHLCRNAGVVRFTNRAFARFADIHSSYLVRVAAPPDLRLAFTEPLSCMLHAERWAAPCAGERILVVGAGGLGLCISFALCVASSSLPFEVIEPIAGRLARVGKAIRPIGSAVASPQGEYDVVFDVSGRPAGLRTAVEAVRSGGRVCSMSHLDGHESSDFLLRALTRRDVAFKVSYLNGERANIERAAHLLTEHWDERWTAAVEVVPFDEVPRTFATRPTSPWCKTIVRVAGV